MALADYEDWANWAGYRCFADWLAENTWYEPELRSLGLDESDLVELIYGQGF
jgi:hypothetical protein